MVVGGLPRTEIWPRGFGDAEDEEDKKGDLFDLELLLSTDPRAGIGTIHDMGGLEGEDPAEGPHRR